MFYYKTFCWNNWFWLASGLSIKITYVQNDMALISSVSELCEFVKMKDIQIKGNTGETWMIQFTKSAPF